MVLDWIEYFLAAFYYGQNSARILHIHAFFVRVRSAMAILTKCTSQLFILVLWNNRDDLPTLDFIEVLNSFLCDMDLLKLCILKNLYLVIFFVEFIIIFFFLLIPLAAVIHSSCLLHPFINSSSVALVGFFLGQVLLLLEIYLHHNHLLFLRELSELFDILAAWRQHI